MASTLRGQAYVFDPSLRIGDIDHAWDAIFRGQYHSTGGGQYCHKPVPVPAETLRSNPYHCTLVPGHAGPCAAHAETTGRVLAWTAPPIPYELRVSEGL